MNLNFIITQTLKIERKVDSRVVLLVNMKTIVTSKELTVLKILVFIYIIIVTLWFVKNAKKNFLFIIRILYIYVLSITK